jgi:hypothetical protein
MTQLQALAGLESGMVRGSRLQIDLRNQLSRSFVWLHTLLEDVSLPRVCIRPLAGPPPDTRWRVLVLGRGGVLLTIALPTSLTDGALHLPNHMPSPQRQALAASILAPLLPHLRSFFKQDLDLQVQDGWESEAVAGPSVRFQVGLAIQALDVILPCFLSETFAPRLIDLLKRRRSSLAIDAPVSVFVGNQLRVPVREVLQLKEGDILLCDQVPHGAAPLSRLYLQSAAAMREGRYLATVRAEDGRVEHLAPTGWAAAGWSSASDMPLAAVDAIEARLSLPATRCRGLAIGEHIGGWKDMLPLEPVQLCIAGGLVAHGRCTSVAGRRGYEIVRIAVDDNTHGVPCFR